MRRRFTVKQTFVVEGIRYSVTRFFDEHGSLGRTVDTPCECFGSRMRCHSTDECPWVLARKAAA